MKNNEVKDYKLGVLGGMGALATIIFFERLVSKTYASKDQEHIDTVILNHVSMPDRTTAILTGEDAELLSFFERDFRLLENVGVDNVVIPCNTSHYFLPKFKEMTSLNIVNMIEEAAKSVAQKFGSNSRCLILGTNGTIQTGLYHNELEKLGVSAISPNEVHQNLIMDIIYGIKGGRTVSELEFSELLQDFKQRYDFDCALLACTELSTISHHEFYVIDAMDALVESAILLSGGKIRL